MFYSDKHFKVMNKTFNVFLVQSNLFLNMKPDFFTFFVLKIIHVENKFCIFIDGRRVSL